jgi:hypothetical protein
MSTRYNNGSHYGNHQRAAELHEQAAHAHRSAAEGHNKQDHLTGHERSRQALEHSHQAYLQTGKARATLEHDGALLGHEETATLAHTLWQGRGCPEGSPDEDWFHASELLVSRNNSVNKTN